MSPMSNLSGYRYFYIVPFHSNINTQNRADCLEASIKYRRIDVQSYIFWTGRFVFV